MILAAQTKKVRRAGGQPDLWKWSQFSRNVKKREHFWVISPFFTHMLRQSFTVCSCNPFSLELYLGSIPFLCHLFWSVSTFAPDRPGSWMIIIIGFVVCLAELMSCLGFKTTLTPGHWQKKWGSRWKRLSWVFTHKACRWRQRLVCGSGWPETGGVMQVL